MMDPEDFDPGITELESQCQTCGHRDPQNPVVCAAFPNGIPLVIMMGHFDHTQPYSENGVLLDGGLRYTPDESQD